MICKLYRKYKEIVNYIIIGVLTTLVSLGAYYGLVLTILDPRHPVQLQVANVISWILSATFAYFTNRRFVFESKDQNIIREVIMFFVARLGSLLIDMGLMFVIVTCYGVNDKVTKIVVQVVVTLANYLFSKFWVFK